MTKYTYVIFTLLNFIEWLGLDIRGSVKTNCGRMLYSATQAFSNKLSK